MTWEVILTTLLVLLLACILVSMYYEIAEKLRITNWVELGREILGGYILAYVLWYERRINYGE